MRVAVLSDIHGNLEALREVLEDIRRSLVDSIVSLGDNIGYGPDPDEVLELLKSYDIPSIMGNHELGIAEPSYLNWFNASARRSLEITGSLLSSQNIHFIKSLPPSRVISGGLLVHGFPPDSITTYLFQVPNDELPQCMLRMEQDLCFVGHTHELALIGFDGEHIQQESLEEGVFDLMEGRKYIVNAGSVGQPRDGDNRSKYVIWDDSARTIDVRFIPYDLVETVRKIIERGFPEINARRLW